MIRAHYLNASVRKAVMAHTREKKASFPGNIIIIDDRIDVKVINDCAPVRKLYYG
jgi:hypothetical protein